MTRWTRIVPLAAALAVAAIPLAEHARMVRAESAGVAVLQRLIESEQAFRRAGGAGFAASLASLTTPCPGQTAAPLEATVVRGVGDRGFEVVLRPAEGASVATPDCHGRPTTTDFYAAVQPASVEAPPRRAYATIGALARVFVFFDGVAPLERDMEAGGLATPLEALPAFRIP